MFKTKRLTLPAELKADGDEGSLSAVFSTFNVVDSDGDVVVPSAFTAGQEVPLVWSHDWARPVGKGTINVTPEHAVFDGRFFTETSWGQDAYQTVKALGSLQEYSWGFRVLDAEPGEMNGQPVRFIKRAEVFEVSPVLVGANRETYTLALKGHDLSFDDHSDRVQGAVDEWLERVKAGCETRQKEGRAISSARRSRMAGVSESLRTAAGEIDAMLVETAPPEKAAENTGAQAQRVAVLRLRSEFAQGAARRTRTLGVSA